MDNYYIFNGEKVICPNCESPLIKDVNYTKCNCGSTVVHAFNKISIYFIKYSKYRIFYFRSNNTTLVEIVNKDDIIKSELTIRDYCPINKSKTQILNKIKTILILQ